MPKHLRRSAARAPLERLAQTEIERGESGMYEILDFVRGPIVITEGDMHVVCYVNPAFCLLAGKSREELIGNSIADVIPDGNVGVLLLDRLKRTGTNESHTQQEVAAPRPLYWMYDIFPVLGEGVGNEGAARVIIQLSEGTPVDARLTSMNEALLVSAVRQHEMAEAAEALNAKLQAEINRREQAQEALVRSEMLANAGRMAASIAHEINNPLAAVMNSLFLARTSANDPKTVREYLEIADGELLRIAHITRQTLGFYRESTVRTNIPVSSLIGSVVSVLQSKIKSTRAVVEQRCDEQLELIGVFGELRQVLANLLANSLHALVPNGRVVLRASPSISPNDGSRRVRITVADSGHGIQAASMNQIFEPFFTTKGSLGTGLGLWVCRQLVEKNGGSIRARSNTHGARRGTAISILLPPPPPLSGATNC